MITPAHPVIQDSDVGARLGGVGFVRGGTTGKLVMKATKSLMSASVNGPPFSWLHAGIGEPATPFAMVLFIPRSARIEGQAFANVTPIRPSPFGPWHTAQFWSYEMPP